MPFKPAPYLASDDGASATAQAAANSQSMAGTESLLSDINSTLSGLGMTYISIPDTPINAATVAANVAYTKLSSFQAYSNLRQMFITAFCTAPTDADEEMVIEFATSIIDSATTPAVVAIPELTIKLTKTENAGIKTWSSVGGTCDSSQILGQYLWYKVTVSGTTPSFAGTTLKVIYRL